MSGYHLQFSINVNPLPHSDLQTSDSLARLHAAILSFTFIDRRIKLVAPRTPPAVPVTVVIAQEIIPASLLAATDLQRLVHRGQKVFREMRRDGAEAGQIGGGGGGGQAAEEVTGDGVSR